MSILFVYYFIIQHIHRVSTDIINVSICLMILTGAYSGGWSYEHPKKNHARAYFPVIAQSREGQNCLCINCSLNCKPDPK